MKAEKYVIVTENGSQSSMRVRFGFGAAGEEVQRLLESKNVERIRVRIDGTHMETVFPTSRPWKLLDIKQRIKSLSIHD